MTKAQEMAARRRENLSKWMHKHQVVQTTIAKRSSLSRSYVSLLFNPERFFGEKTARKLEEALNMPTGYLDDDQAVERAVETWASPDDLQPGAYGLVTRVAVALVSGQLVDQEQTLPPLAFRREWFTARGVGLRKNLRVTVAIGDAMEPYIQNGDEVLVDIAQTEVKDSGVYAIAYGDELRIRRLSRRFDGGLKIMSDHNDYPDEDLTPEQAGYIKVIGRVVWRAG